MADTLADAMRATRAEVMGEAPTGQRDLLVGIDVGGTTVKVALVSQEGEVIANDAVRTESMKTPEEVAAAAQAIKAIADAAKAEGDRVAAVGLAVPGVVSPDDELLLSPNITLDLGALVEKLKDVFGVGVYPVNDANAAALGELWQGAGSGDSLVFVTLGTGVGGGVVVGGKVIVGGKGSAGEIGHLTIEPDGRLCGCGRGGCLEMYASSRGVVLSYRDECEKSGAEPVELEHDAHALPIFDAARNGSPEAVAAVDRMGRALGQAMATIACVVDPAAFVIGGGMSPAFDLFGPALMDEYRKDVISACADTPIVVAELGNLAGMLGSAYHAANRAGLAVKVWQKS